MDPLAALRRMLNSINNGDYSDALQAMNDYYQWRVKRGFEPNVTWTTDSSLQSGDEYISHLSGELEAAMNRTRLVCHSPRRCGFERQGTNAGRDVL